MGPPGPAFFRALSEDAKALAYTDAAGSVHVEGLADGKELGPFKGHQGEVMNVMFSRDRRLLGTGSRDGTILIWGLTGVKKSGGKK